jgi:hypothetical protein
MAAPKSPTSEQIAADKKIVTSLCAIVTTLRERYPTDLDLHSCERSLRAFTKTSPGPKPKPTTPPTTPPAERPDFRSTVVEKGK